jgi:cobalamin biosynthesis protein CobD/CbiB
MNKDTKTRWSEAVIQRTDNTMNKDIKGDVCPTLIYGFWTSLLVSLFIVLSVLWITASDHLFWYLLFIVLSVLLLFTASEHLFWYLLFNEQRYQKRWSEAVNQSRTDNTMNKRYQKRCSEAVKKSRTGIFCSLHCLSYFFYGFWSSLLISLFIVLSVLWITASDHLFWYLLFILLSVLLWFTASNEMIRSRKSTNRQYNEQKIPKEMIRSRKSK